MEESLLDSSAGACLASALGSGRAGALLTAAPGGRPGGVVSSSLVSEDELEEMRGFGLGAAVKPAASSSSGAAAGAAAPGFGAGAAAGPAAPPLVLRARAEGPTQLPPATSPRGDSRSPAPRCCRAAPLAAAARFDSRGGPWRGTTTRAYWLASSNLPSFLLTCCYKFCVSCGHARALLRPLAGPGYSCGTKRFIVWGLYVWVKL